MQVEYVRRLSGGLQLNANYTFGRGYGSTRYSFRVPRILTRDSGTEGDVEHAVKANAVYELPFGRGRRFLANAGRGRGSLVAGWKISGTTRLQSGRLFDLGNVRVVGMSEDEVQDLFRLRLERPDIAYSWPAGHRRKHDEGVQHQRDVTDRVRRARRAERPVLRSGQRPGLHRADRQRVRRLRRAVADRHRTDGEELRSQRAEDDPLHEAG